MTATTRASRPWTSSDILPAFRVARRSDEWTALALIAVALGIGLALRVFAARGDLWLDEIWSLDLVAGLTSPDQVFWAISHDNNHFLNSLWIYLVGQTQAPIVYRVPSIVFGTATIGVAARIGWRVNPAAAVATAFLTCCSYTLVDYGSEARGYGALILAIVLTLGLGRRWLDRLAAGDNVWTCERWILGLVIALGACAHLTMAAEAGCLGLATLLRLRRNGVGLLAAIDRTMTLFRPILVLLLAVGTCIVAGILTKGSFSVGGYAPFQPASFVAGYGGLLAEILGVHDLVSPALAMLLAATSVACGFALRLIDRRWSDLALASLVVWPGLLFLGRVANLEFPRYFLVAGMILPILLAEMAGRLWGRNRLGRCCAVALVTALCVGQVRDIEGLLTLHRGSPSATLALVADGASIRILEPGSFPFSVVVDHYNRRTGRRIALLPARATCDATDPGWSLGSSDFEEPAPDISQAGPEACREDFVKIRTFPAALWSGRTWTVYKRQRSGAHLVDADGAGSPLPRKQN